MYAVIALGGKQYRVREGERLLVDRLHAEEGSAVHPPVLMIGGDGTAVVDADGLAKATVVARVKEHTLGKKINVFRYKAKTNWAKRRGHRSRLTLVEIETIAL